MILCLSSHALLSSPLLSRSEEHTSELQSHLNLVCRLLLEKKTQPETGSPRGVQLAIVDGVMVAGRAARHCVCACRDHVRRVRRRHRPPHPLFFFLMHGPPPRLSPFPHPAPLRI